MAGENECFEQQKIIIFSAVSKKIIFEVRIKKNHFLLKKNISVLALCDIWGRHELLFSSLYLQQAC